MRFFQMFMATKRRSTAVVSDMKAIGFDRLICCGDLVGYGPNPTYCVEKFRDLQGLFSDDVPLIMGNHDKAAISGSIVGFNNEGGDSR